jgi:hypothetical protein
MHGTRTQRRQDVKRAARERVLVLQLRKELERCRSLWTDVATLGDRALMARRHKHEAYVEAIREEQNRRCLGSPASSLLS